MFSLGGLCVGSKLPARLQRQISWNTVPLSWVNKWLFSECCVDKSVDFGGHLWFCLFFSPGARWGQRESQPHCKAWCHDTDVSGPSTPAVGKASEIPVVLFLWGNLNLPHWGRIVFIYVLELSETLSRTCAFCSAEYEDGSHPYLLFCLLGAEWSVTLLWWIQYLLFF